MDTNNASAAPVTKDLDGRPEASESDGSGITIHALISFVACPFCDSENRGFLNDPRGGDFVCEQCDLAFHIPADSVVDFG